MGCWLKPDRGELHGGPAARALYEDFHLASARIFLVSRQTDKLLLRDC
jgi:hypothetical protein